MHRTHRKDENHNAIKKAFELHGFTCADTCNVGEGVPDMIVARDGVTILVEAKNGASAKFTPAQVEFWATWRGQLLRVDSVDEVHEFCNTFIRRQHGKQVCG